MGIRAQFHPPLITHRSGVPDCAALTAFPARGETRRFVMTLGRTKFETALQVRPDDLDMNRHVHASRYQDYVLAARYDQMARCYGMSMEEFLQLGFGWYVRTAQIEYKRPLGLGEHFIVRTSVAEIMKYGVKVQFEIIKSKTGKFACDG